MLMGELPRKAKGVTIFEPEEFAGPKAPIQNHEITHASVN